MIRFTIFVLLLMVFALFAQTAQIDSSLSRTKREYINPSYSFPAPHIKEQNQGYPYPSRLYPCADSGTNHLKKFLGFCDYIKRQFNESNMTVGEAEDFYARLEMYLKIRDDAYGMPGPNLPRRGPVILKKRVKVKKLNDSQYVIFYF